MPRRLWYLVRECVCSVCLCVCLFYHVFCHHAQPYNRALLNSSVIHFPHLHCVKNKPIWKLAQAHFDHICLFCIPPRHRKLQRTGSIHILSNSLDRPMTDSEQAGKRPTGTVHALGVVNLFSFALHLRPHC